jgi:hypothetical protein
MCSSRFPVLASPSFALLGRVTGSRQLSGRTRGYPRRSMNGVSASCCQTIRISRCSPAPHAEARGRAVGGDPRRTARPLRRGPTDARASAPPPCSGRRRSVRLPHSLRRSARQRQGSARRPSSTSKAAHGPRAGRVKRAEDARKLSCGASCGRQCGSMASRKANGIAGKGTGNDDQDQAVQTRRLRGGH